LSYRGKFRFYNAGIRRRYSIALKILLAFSALVNFDSFHQKPAVDCAR